MEDNRKPFYIVPRKPYNFKWFFEIKLVIQSDNRRNSTYAIGEACSRKEN